MKRIHATDPTGPRRCRRGQVYPAGCRGGWPILPGGWQPIPGLAAQGISLRETAGRDGLTPGTVRRIAHGT